MNTHIITNDKSFRKFLNELDEETLKLYGWKFVHAIDMRMRLDDDDLDLAYFIADNYGDIEYVSADQLMLHQLEDYLFRLPKEDVRDLYHDYIEAECVIEDLMELSNKTRITMIAHFKKCDEVDLKRFDTVWAN